MGEVFKEALILICWHLIRAFPVQVFEELEEIGKTIQEDISDAGMPVHGAMGGDISKCPYYAAKMGMCLYLALWPLCHFNVF